MAAGAQPEHFLHGPSLGFKFLNMFHVKEDDVRKSPTKKSKAKTKGFPKTKWQPRTSSIETSLPISNIEIPSNPSAFSVFANIRHSMLERHLKEKVHLSSSTSEWLEDVDIDDEEVDKSKALMMKVPKIVGIGMCGVFELIRESRSSHPALCSRALHSLLDILQGQTPEGLCNEPSNVIDCLFDLLMEIAISCSNEDLGALSCACLLSLVVARGDTAKTLTAISTLLRSSPSMASQRIKVPAILNLLQKSVQSVLLGKTLHPSWLSTGVVHQALLESWQLGIPLGEKQDSSDCAIASDGCHLYIQCARGLFKVGTGYSGTIKGHVYASRNDLKSDCCGWLCFTKGMLFYQLVSSADGARILMNLNIETLEEEKPFHIENLGAGKEKSVMFSSDDYIGEILPGRDEGFQVYMYSPTTSSMTCVNELQFKLARKCMEVFGYSVIDQQKDVHTINIGIDEDPIMICGGKDFTLLRTVLGKVFYSGKSQSLGIKQGSGVSSKWAELPITKSPKIVQCCAGHESQHALLVADDGCVYFVGTAKRGEDGEPVKGRRVPKPCKPKKIPKFDGKIIVSAACNNGSSAFVSKQGELYLFGKDNTYADQASGLVTEVQDCHVKNISLGKAHGAILTSSGDVYTFGINNKGQCGRDFGLPPQKEGGTLAAGMATGGNDEENDEDEADGDESEGICSHGSHKWKTEQCMVCTVCGECTGYGASCISSGGPNRVPGMLCGCGTGESGCSKCGCCKSCGGESQDKEFSGGWLEALARHGELIPLDLIAKKHIEDRLRHQLKRRVAKAKALLDDQGSASGDESRDQDKDSGKTVTSQPCKIVIGIGDVPAVQISCGLHHTVLLLDNGDVYVFGSGQFGQLGQGDIAPRGLPTLVALPVPAVQVAAGSNHSAVLLENGQVFTWGNNQGGQLGRSAPADEKETKLWFTRPGPIPGVGVQCGRRATWIGASGDQTYLKIDESLINAHTLSKSKVFASNDFIGVIPMDNTSAVKCLMINSGDGSCRSFSGSDQVCLKDKCICLDPAYNVLWSFDPSTCEVSCYNILTSEMGEVHGSSSASFKTSILDPEFAIPCKADSTTSRSHSALNLLCCLDTLTAAQNAGVSVAEEKHDSQSSAKVYTKDDFTAINRFESPGGGWGYSGHSVEAIRFSVDTDILLGGFGLFGGRGEYTAKIKVYDLGPEGGEHETDGELLAESDDVSYECGSREKYAILFDEPLTLTAHCWYVAWARVSGPSSDCGSSGQVSLTSDDQVIFQFKSSKKSNNGTDVNAGQIPQVLYRLPHSDTTRRSSKVKETEPIHILSSQFSCSVSPVSFDSMLNLLEWSWATFNKCLIDMQSLKGINLAAALLDLQRLVYISAACLRLLKTYICKVYPNTATTRKTTSETETLAECVGKTRLLLCKILSEKCATPIAVRKELIGRKEELNYPDLMDVIMKECHHTFVSCFHAFYPTNQLKWMCLCYLLKEIAPDDNFLSSGCLLAAVLEALCHPSVKLTSLLPIYKEIDASTSSMQRQLSADDNAGCANFVGEYIRYPLLVSYMDKMTMVPFSNANTDGAMSFREVLEKLLSIVVLPVQHALIKEQCLTPSLLVHNTCLLLACVVSELSAAATGSENDIQNGSRPVLSTPSRFSRVSQGRSWNTGNGSPDAVCFSVDAPGVVIVGFGVYGGLGQYEYELELLDDVEGGGDAHNHRWSSLEIVKGTYGPDDCVSDIAEIRFERPVPIKEGIKYAVRLRNHGNRTSNGDVGLSQVKGSDGVTYTFSSCSLSSNGTTHTRGQIPTILYYSVPREGDTVTPANSQAAAEMQSRNSAITISSAIIRAATELLEKTHSCQDVDIFELLGSAHIFTSLLPFILASIGPVASTDPRSAVQVLALIEDILPHVAAVNLHGAAQPGSPGSVSSSHHSECGTLSPTEAHAITTSTHYTIVESEHPYKPASLATYKVRFPDCVQWLSIEFDPQCGTAQPEDSLRLFIPNKTSNKDNSSGTSPLVPVLTKYYGSTNWPTMALLLPGNEVHFFLETASDYVKDEKATMFGFKCSVIGYEWSTLPEEGIIHLEKELAYLGGMCASSLLKKDLSLPATSTEEAEEDIDALEETSQQIFSNHSSLLSKGFAMNSPPTVHQALDGNLPLCIQSNERAFLKDFVNCTAGTSGGRLARWLQPDSFIDPRQCDILYDKDNIKCNWPAVITIQTRDQYGDLVQVPNLRVEAKAVPVIKQDCSHGNKKTQKSSKKSIVRDVTYGGHAPPKINTAYEPTTTSHVNYVSITMMKAYENYSFEELRLASPTIRRPSETMLIKANNDGSYHANWTPASVGMYAVHVTIDGYPMDDIAQIEIGEPPQGVTPPNPTLTKKPHQPSKVRKYIANFSQGLRIRSSPSLQSEQIGVVGVNNTITFIDEVHNEDGVWLRLNSETIHKYCGSNGYKEAWCLSYNQHLGKTLLVPVEEPKSIIDEIIKDTIAKKIPTIGNIKSKTKSAKGTLTHGPGVYQVVKCGSSGHNIRSRPSLKASPVGMMVHGNQLTVMQDITNTDGATWVKLDKDSMQRYCESTDGEAWSLARFQDAAYLLHETDIEREEEKSKIVGSFEFDFASPQDRTTQARASGFDFKKAAANSGPLMFGSGSSSETRPTLSVFGGARIETQQDHQHGPFVFGQSPSGTSPLKFSPSAGHDPLFDQMDKKFAEKVKESLDGTTQGNKVTDEISGTSSNQDIMKGHFSIGRVDGHSSPKSGLSPKTSRKAKVSHAKRERTSSPAPKDKSPARSRSGSLKSDSARYREFFKPAISASVAECVRAVFGAFLWHEGIVHDAMACASFLKFHPNLNKQATSITRRSPEQLASQEKLKNRHSADFSQSMPASALAALQDSEELLAKLYNGNKECDGDRTPSGSSASPRDSPKKITSTDSSPKKTANDSTQRSLLRDDSSKKTSRETSPKTKSRESSPKSVPSRGSPKKTQTGIVVDSEKVSSPRMSPKNSPRHSPKVSPRSSPKPSPKSSPLLSRKTRHTSDSSDGNMKSLSTVLTRERSASTSKTDTMNTKKSQSSITKELAPESALPPTLKHLVSFWEDLSHAILNVAAQQILLPSPAVTSKSKSRNEKKEKEKEKGRKDKKKREKAPQAGRGNLFGEAAGIPVGSGEREAVCELCGGVYPHPVTYHMRQTHPGCGKHAGGQGYNSSGNFCGGWAGNCGDGGRGGSSWYLMCDKCREKYLKDKRTNACKDKSKKMKKKAPAIRVLKAMSPVEVHHIMKENAMFLLDLASAAGPMLPSTSPVKKQSKFDLPTLSELEFHPQPEFPATVPFQFLKMLRGEHHPEVLPIALRDVEMLARESLVREGSKASTESRLQAGSSGAAVGNAKERAKSAGQYDLRRVPFQRSISMTSSMEEEAAKIAAVKTRTQRRRNNSGSTEGGSSLLRRPSPALAKLVTGGNNEKVVQRPVVSFILQRYDLDAIRIAMKQAVRKAACRVHAMQALNWLLRNVTQTTCLHDLLWHFVSALMPAATEKDDDTEQKKEKKEQDQEKDVIMCEHPLSDITVGGDAVSPLPVAFHVLLQTISDMMMLLPHGSALQLMALRCWCLRFRPSDHVFLHHSHVFSNINKILSKSDEGDPEDTLNTSASFVGEIVLQSEQTSVAVTCPLDITSVAEIQVSSRAAMIQSLTDGSTETFWESGDEDRNKTKAITIVCSNMMYPMIIGIHIDNSRDLGNKVTNMTFNIGCSSDDLKKWKQIEIESRHSGWITWTIPSENNKIIKVDLKGPDNSLRVRQIKLLGKLETESINIRPSVSTILKQQRDCEAETLKVFRLLTSQVFGRLIADEDSVDNTENDKSKKGDKGLNDCDLREHMVGILFSRSKLTHLQKQVCSHIVQAIRKETCRVREEWESSLLVKETKENVTIITTSDAYCFELLSMVLALSGSSVGRAYIAQQVTLIQDVLTLLHTGSPRVQRQVASILRRVLPEISPQKFSTIIAVSSLPSTDISILSQSSKSQCYTEETVGILDMLLACISKALVVQTKVKGGTSGGFGSRGISTLTVATMLNPCAEDKQSKTSESKRWWLKGSMPQNIADVIIKLLKDMSAGLLSNEWCDVTKGAVAEAVLALTKLEENKRVPTECMKTHTIWLSLASLCVLDEDHVDRLSSGHWIGSEGHQSKHKPMCDNHDDGETAAIILCNLCGNLCADCDKFLHLHRRTKSHQRQVFKEEEESIKVDLHEGCGRTKLFWVMTLADSKTLKAMVEFKGTGSSTTSGSASSSACRFCGSTSNTGLLAIGYVCTDPDCQKHAENACGKTHPCGHQCGGIKEEERCLPCLYGCSGNKHGSMLKQDADDMCMICFTEALSAAPAIQINIEHGVLRDLLSAIRALEEDVQRKAVMRLEYEGLHKCEAITTPGARFYNDPTGFAMNRYAYYVCFKCKKAYYGGEARCDQEADIADEYDPTELVCGACSDISRAQMCPKHGTDYLEYKCRYCCSVAVFFCFGTTHFCNSCHDDFQRVTSVAKADLPHCPAGPRAKRLDVDECPLHVEHPPTGEEFALGCGICRNAHTF
ncbi:E3 ubiquitin-protein ligase MYCBP2-like isoform X2 [Ptychodera flava]|uniref:E3 ubiquitin-protein ligase MYCBP2-like isoform X2 n=1 Tax=Ptychodera flava TaxID=63121 RepID=UPI003969CC82